MPRAILDSLLPSLLVLFVATPAVSAEGPRWCSSAVIALEEQPGDDSPATPKTAHSKAAAPRTATPRTATPKTATPRTEAEQPAALGRVSVRWELEIRGALATGSLIETFRSEASAPVTVRHEVSPTPGFQLAGARVMIDEQETELETAAPLPEDRSSPQGQRRRALGIEQSGTFEVPSGASVEVRTSLQTPLSFAEGWYELELPVLTRDCGRQAGRVKETSREAGVPLQVSLQLHHEGGNAELDSSTHGVSDRTESWGTTIELSEPALVAEGPFLLRYRLESKSEDEPTLTGWVSEQRDDGTTDLLVVLTPPDKAPVGAIAQTDAVFVLDTSGSMKGKKIESLRSGVASALEFLDESDSFSLIRFAQDSSSYGAGLASAGAYERDDAKAWLAGLEADGGTRLTEALTQAIGVATAGEHHPIVVVVTDGAIADPEPVEELLSEEGGTVRVLFLGIGAEPQSAVLQRLAATARGEAAFAREASEVATVLSRLFGSFSSPLAWDLRLEAPGTEIVATWPERVPDLYQGRPVTVFVRVRGELPETLRLRGASVDGENVLDHSLRVGELPAAPGLRGPRELEGSKRRGR